jgi:hypothetical protein
MDLSSFFGYVPPRGQTAQNVPVQQAVWLVPLAVAQSDVQYLTQPVAQSADQPVVRRGGHSLVEAPRTDVPQRPARITWP